MCVLARAHWRSSTTHTKQGSSKAENERTRDWERSDGTGWERRKESVVTWINSRSKCVRARRHKKPQARRMQRQQIQVWADGGKWLKGNIKLVSWFLGRLGQRLLCYLWERSKIESPSKALRLGALLHHNLALRWTWICNVSTTERRCCIKAPS